MVAHLIKIQDDMSTLGYITKYMEFIEKFGLVFGGVCERVIRLYCLSREPQPGVNALLY